jgi:putative endonuclease
MKTAKEKRDVIPQVKSWHLYVIRTADDTLYTGITTDVDRRFEEHRSRGCRSAKYFLAHPPQTIVLAARIGERSLALKVEYRFKRLPCARKEKIVKTGKLKFDENSGRILN